MTNILKVTTTLLHKYDIEIVDKLQKKPILCSVGVTEMGGPMTCRIKRRTLDRPEEVMQPLSEKSF